MAETPALRYVDPYERRGRVYLAICRLSLTNGDRVTIIASKQGRPENPAWYHNVCKNPDVVYCGQPFRAEVVLDETERRRLWDLADRIFPQFRDYRAQAVREIPIVQLLRR